MKRRIEVMVRGVGASVPDAIRTNAELSERCDTSDEWITTRTGIRERRIVGAGESTLTMAVAAGRAALADAKLGPDDIDLIIVATCTPAVQFPATACFVQHELGCRHIPAFDLTAACSGFVYGMVTGAQLMQGSAYRNVLVIGADAMSTVSDLEDRSICILLGDGAGAAVLGVADNDVSGFYHHHLGSDGSGAEMIWVPAGGSLMPATAQTVAERLHYMKMSGREVFKFAVTKMREIIGDALTAGGLGIDDVALVIPHQSNQRIIESLGGKLGLPTEKIALNIDRYGNTSAASIPIAMTEAWQAGRIKRGDWVILAGVGAGLTWGSLLMRL
jgi:3-oxoacyl-[acyl-carrier-protein] synthase III